MFLGFAILAGIWPLHTWAPTGHVAAPTAGSMLLAGIVMKLGAYAALRVAMNLFPDGFQMWSKWIAVLGVIGIVYAAAVALRQRDLKFVIGYSSVSHMGFVLLGLATANVLGVGGAVLQMFSHGVIAALLFAVAGRMIYRRTHTRDLDALSEMGLGRALPFAAFCFVDRLSRIDGHSRFQRICGRDHDPPRCVESLSDRRSHYRRGNGARGGVHTARAEEDILWRGHHQRHPTSKSIGEFEPITVAEKLGAGLLMFATLAVGLYPKFLLDRIMPAVEAMRVVKTGG